MQSWVIVIHVYDLAKVVEHSLFYWLHCEMLKVNDGHTYYSTSGANLLVMPVLWHTSEMTLSSDHYWWLCDSFFGSAPPIQDFTYGQLRQDGSCLDSLGQRAMQNVEMRPCTDPMTASQVWKCCDRGMVVPKVYSICCCMLWSGSEWMG